MTRKDYVAFANELGDALAESLSGEATQQAIDAVIRVLRADNSRFREEQFREAINHRANTGRLVRVGQTNFAGV